MDDQPELASPSIAIALQYLRDDPSSAPRVTAKGEMFLAERILEIAEQNDIPIVDDIPLAEALNALDVGDEIPEDLYRAVSNILQWVASLREDQSRRG